MKISQKHTILFRFQIGTLILGIKKELRDIVIWRFVASLNMDLQKSKVIELVNMVN